MHIQLARVTDGDSSMGGGGVKIELGLETTLKPGRLSKLPALGRETVEFHSPFGSASFGTDCVSKFHST